MKIFGKEIEDVCRFCGDVLTCDLFRAGHGIDQERNRIAEMWKCQMDYKEKHNIEEPKRNRDCE